MVDTVLQIFEPFALFHDIDGMPLEDGYIYIGAAGLDPVTNPIDIFSDTALSIPLAQPIRTMGGYCVNAGTPVNIYLDLAYYSITVLNKRGTLIYSDLLVEYINKIATGRFLSIQSAADSDLTGFDCIETTGFYPGWEGTLRGPKGGGKYCRNGTTGTPGTLFTNNNGFYDSNGDGFSLAYDKAVCIYQFGVVGDGIDLSDTANFQKAMNFLDSINSGSAVLTPIIGMDLSDADILLTSQITNPTNRFDLFSNGLARIKVDSLPAATYPFSNFPRGSTIRNILIYDTTLNKTKYGWYFNSTSAIYFENIGAAGLARGMAFNNSNDFKGAHGYNGYQNAFDFYFEPSGVCSSINFESFRIDESDGPIYVGTSITNVRWVAGGFRTKTSNNNDINVQIDAQWTNNCAIVGCRFEHEGSGTGLTHLKVRGASGSFPAVLVLEGNYYSLANGASGSILNHIHINGNIGRIKIEKEFFISEPTNADILNDASTPNLSVEDTCVALASRTTPYVKLVESGTAAYNEHRLKPILIQMDRVGFPAPNAGGVGNKQVVITFATETRTPAIDMPTSITDFKLYFRNGVSGAILEGMPVLSTYTNGSMTFEYVVKTVGSDAAGEVQFDLYVWGY